MGTFFNRNPGLTRAEQEIGFIDVGIHNSRGVPKMDSTGFADCYVTVAVENKDGNVVTMKKTKVQKQTLMPNFEEDFEFPIRDQTQIIHIKLLDHDDFGRDDLIGSFKLQMTDLTHADKSEAIKVRNKDGDEVIGEDGTPCVISISTKFSPHADKAAIALTKSIYEPDAGDGDLKLALRAAAGTHPKKRVLIMFGSDWSMPCRKLFFLFRDNKSCRLCLDQFFELVLLDAEMEQNFPILKKLGDPQHLGFPVLVILDAYGRYITTKSSNELEADPSWAPQAFHPKKVFKFLQYWREGGPNNTDMGDLADPKYVDANW